jgi:hypothetical protein
VDFSYLLAFPTEKIAIKSQDLCIEKYIIIAADEGWDGEGSYGVLLRLKPNVCRLNKYIGISWE